jgi:hypothetical protein
MTRRTPTDALSNTCLPGAGRSQLGWALGEGTVLGRDLELGDLYAAEPTCWRACDIEENCNGPVTAAQTLGLSSSCAPARASA